MAGLIGAVLLGVREWEGEPAGGEPVAWALEGEPRPVADHGAQTPSAGIRLAIRDLLSGKPERERNGEEALKRAGAAAIPQLRYWSRRARFGAERVEAVIREIARKELGRLADGSAEAEPVFPRDLTADDFFHRKLIQAQALYRKGDYESARRIAEAVLVLDEDSPLAFELRWIVRVCRERMVVRELEPRLDAGSRAYEVGEVPVITFRLTNRSGRPAVVELERGILGSVSVVVTSRFLDGGWKRDEKRIHLKVPADLSRIELKNGEVWEREYSFPIDDGFPMGDAVGRVQLAATFRPRRWEIEGEKDSNIPLTAATSEFWIVPPSHKRAVESPIRRLQEALILKRDELFLVAGWIAVWAGEHDPFLNEETVATLVGALGHLTPAEKKLARMFLEEATGRRFEETEDWQKWWASIRGPEAASEEGADDGDLPGSRDD